MPFKVPMSSPDLTNTEREAIAAVMRTPNLSMGGEIAAFEAAICEYTGARHAIGVSSGTSGLHLCVRAAGIGDGDLVITSLGQVATAVGRPLVSAVSFLAGVAVLPTQLFFMVSRWWRYLDISDESRMAVLLAAIGGLPPLRHMRVGASARPAIPKKGRTHA